MNRLVVWIIWFSLISAIIIYGVVGTISAPATPDPSSPDPTLLTILSLAAGATIALGFAVRVLFLYFPIHQGKLVPSDPSHFGRYLTTMIIIFALTEAAAIFGLVLRFNGASTQIFYSFLAASLIAMIIHAPLHMSRS